MPVTPDISFVIPVFKKADVLPYVLRALAGQTLNAEAEYIFVDDASPDNSVDILRQSVSLLPRITIIENGGNAGPSIRLNQGVASAAGRYLCLIDADELIVPNVVDTMLRLLRHENAQLVHGKVEHSAMPPSSITPAPVAGSPPYRTSDTPFETVLAGRGFVRMTWVTETDLFRASGGCDESIFVQDESIALKLASGAKRMIDLRATMTYAPRIGSHISSNDSQLLHDRFFAHYNLLNEHRELNPRYRRLLTKKCISTARKAVSRSGLPFSPLHISLLYAKAKLGMLKESDRNLDILAAAFRRLPGVRRPQPGGNRNEQFI